MNGWIFWTIVCVLLPILVIIISSLDRICNNVARLGYLLSDILLSLDHMKTNRIKSDTSDADAKKGGLQAFIELSNKKNIFDSTITLNNGKEIIPSENTLKIDNNVMIIRTDDLDNAKFNFELYPLDKIEKITFKLKSKNQAEIEAMKE